MAMAQLPLRFEANLGQMNPDVRYAARSGGFLLLLTNQGPSFRVPGSGRLDLSLVDSNHAPQIEALERQSAHIDSFVGPRSRWRSNIPSYSRVRYRSVYPGVDVDYYGNQGRLEYDFVLAPGADPNRIRMKFGSQAKVSLSKEGDLVLEMDGKRLIQKRPFIYQEDPKTSARVEVAGGYRLLGDHTVGVRLANYDRKRKLVIDPTLTYLTYWGGPGVDQINAAKLDSQGRLYLAGQTDSGYVPYNPDDPYSTVNTGGIDIFLSIFTTDNGNYNLQYSTYLGGTGDDVPLGVDVDSSGVAYLTGYTTSTDFPTQGAVLTSPSATYKNVFVAKLDPSQSGTDALIFASYIYGSDGDSVGNGIAAGNDGRIYLIGNTQAGDFPVTASAKQTVLWGSQDAFIVKMDPGSGGIDYATYLGGEDIDDGRAILVDSKDLVYFAVSTLSSEFPMAGYQYSIANSGGSDVAVGVMDLNQSGDASIVYSTYYGGSGNEEVRAMAFDQNQNLIITGYTLSTDLPLTGDAIQRVNNGGGDAFVAIINPRLNFQKGLLYSTYLGGKSGDVGYALATDSAGYIYVTGYTLSSDFPIAGKVPQPTWGGGTDVFLTRFKTGVAGKPAIDFSTYMGGPNLYVPSGVQVGSDGRVYVAGTGGIGLPSSQFAIQGGYYSGSSDGFFFVLTPDPGSQPQGSTTSVTGARRTQIPRSTSILRK